MANIHTVGVAGDSSAMHPKGNYLFRKRWGQIDWRKIASVDVDRVAQELDFQALQDNIMSIAFCNVETEFQGIDPNFIKLFRIGQLIIEYLLHSQQYLGKQSSSLEQQCLQIKKEQVSLKKEFVKLKEEKCKADDSLKTVQKENRKRRKVIEAYQDMMKAGATGLHPCPVCKREFISMDYLKSHLERRHPEQVSEKKDQAKISHEELETRLLQQMFDHLRTSENQLREEIKLKEINTKDDQSALLKDWKEMEHKQLLADYQGRFEEWKVEEIKKITAAQISENSSWRVEQQEQIMLEYQELQKPILQELDQLREENLILKKEKLSLELALQKKEEELVNISSVKRHSHIGHLEDAKEIQLDGIQSGQKTKPDIDILTLKQTMEQEVTKLRTLVKKRDTYWKSRLEELQSLAMASPKVEMENSRAESTLVSKEIESLKLKQKKQEQLLQSQHNDIVSLRKQEPAKLNVLEDNDSHTDGIGISSSIVVNGEDKVDLEDRLQFSPMKSRPMIKTIYPHNSSELEIIRQQTHALFIDTLSERNIKKDQLGLTAHDMETKMALLHEERKTKNSSYDEYRHRISEKLEEYSKYFLQAKKCTEESQQSHKQTHVKGLIGKPPKPCTVPPSHKADDSLASVSDSSIDTSFLCDKNDDTTNFAVNTGSEIPAENLLPLDTVNHRNEDEDSDTEENTDEEIEAKFTELSHVNKNEVKAKDMRVNGAQGFFGAITNNRQPSVLDSELNDKITRVKDACEQDESSWDSSEELSVKNTTSTAGRISSTPMTGKVLSPTKKILAGNSGAPPDNVSLGSIDLSSSNEVDPNPHHKVMVSSNDKLPIQSKNGTSQSALTNISLDEFDLSDLSDIL